MIIIDLLDYSCVHFRTIMEVTTHRRTKLSVSRVSAAAWRLPRERHPADRSPPQLPGVAPGMETAQGLADDCCHSLWSLVQASVTLCTHTSNLFIEKSPKENQILVTCRLKEQSSHSKANTLVTNPLHSDVR